MNNDTFIFTEAYNCGKILKKALETFFQYHPNRKVHVFGTAKDFKQIKEYIPKIEIIDLTTDDVVRNLYKEGHLGTAYIFTKVLKKHYGDYKNVIHFDSDIVFRKESLSDVENALSEGFDLVGQRRSYEKNKCNRSDLIGLKDVVGTCFFGVNVDKISNFDFETLHRMVVGYYNPLNHAILDFFDPISFDILKNGGKIKYLDFNGYGSTDENGSQENIYGELNTMFDFGENIIHFAGVGSGLNFFHNGSGNVPVTYSDWAIKRYALYLKVFYDEEIGVDYDKEVFEKVKKVI